MAVFLKQHKQKPTLVLSTIERRLFVVFTLLLTMAAIWQLSSSRHQRQALKPLKQYQYLFNQSCQQALNHAEDRNNPYCLTAQQYNQAFTQTLKDQHIELTESIDLEQMFKAHYRPYSD
ncbi:nucleotidyl transferase family protein [Vibrio gangliei]|uniref:hypothetical protein n=1 Tax=Vibrio gangliei TaxID=2077090 RepID=UPI000D01490B|nr:hypothetical protein [Vibrio gangliei]